MRNRDATSSHFCDKGSSAGCADSGAICWMLLPLHQPAKLPFIISRSCYPYELNYFHITIWQLLCITLKRGAPKTITTTTWPRIASWFKNSAPPELPGGSRRSGLAGGRSSRFRSASLQGRRVDFGYSMIWFRFRTTIGSV